MADTPVQGNRRRLHWSERQKEVLDLIADGCTNAEIGERLGITFATAKWHVSELITELGVDSREDVAAYWRAERGLRGRLRRAVGAIGGLGLWKVAAGAVVAAGAAGVVVAVIALRPSPHAAAGIVSPTATASSATPASARTATSRPTTAAGSTTGRLAPGECSPLNTDDPRAPIPVDVSFTDPLQGWVLAAGNTLPGTGSNQQTCAWVGRTDDGGSTWSALPAPDVPLYNSSDGAEHIVFTGVDTGWLWGPALYFTRDGGRTWTAQHVASPGSPTDIVSFAAVGRGAWAIRGPTGSDVEDCPCSLEHTVDNGTDWTPITQPALRSASVAQVVATSFSDAWVAVSIPTDAQPPASTTKLEILVTHDGGAHWSETGAPPADPIPWGQLVVSIPDTLWWVQWGEPATNMSSKWIYRSDDGGAHWQLVADVVLPTGGKLQNLPGVGDNPQLTVVTQSLLFLSMDRQTPYVSRDGGETWAPAISFETSQAGAMGFVGPTVFGDATHGVVADFGLGLFVTADSGRTWTLVHLPRT